MSKSMNEVEQNYNDDLATFRQYQEEVQKNVNVTTLDIDVIKSRLSSSLTGNSYLAETYQKEYPSLKQFKYTEKYQDLIKQLKSADTIEMLEKLKAQSENLKNELYQAYEAAKKGAISELQQIEQSGIVSRNKRQLLLDVEKDMYLLETSQKKYDYMKKLDYDDQYQKINERLNNATSIEEIDALKVEIQDLRARLNKDIENAPYEDAIAHQNEMLANIYNQLSCDDLALACDFLGYSQDSNSAVKFKEKADSDYNEMLLANADLLPRLYEQRDLYLRDMIKKAFFLKCLKVDTKVNSLTKKEKKEKYDAYNKKGIDYPDDFKDKVRQKLLIKYQEQEIPIWLLVGEEFDDAFNQYYSVSSRMSKLQ